MRYLPYLLYLIVFVFMNAHGLGITIDSTHYLAAASSLAQEGSLFRADQNYFVEWPPLYPILLSPSYYFSQAFIFFLHLLSGGVVLFFLGKVAQTVLKLRQEESLVLFICFGLSTPFLMASHFVWSELIFTLLLLALVYFYWTYDKGSRYGLGVLALLATLLVAQRFAAMLFLLPLALTDLLFYKRWKPALSLCFPSGIFLGIWFLYAQWRVTSIPASMTPDPWEAFGTSLFTFMNILSIWFVPEFVPLIIRWALLVLFFILLGLYLAKESTLNPRLMQSLVWLSLYILILSASGERSGMDAERHLIAVFPFFLLWVMKAFQLAKQGLKKYHRARYGLFAISFLWLGYQLSRGLYNAWRWSGLQG